MRRTKASSKIAQIKASASPQAKLLLEGGDLLKIDNPTTINGSEKDEEPKEIDVKVTKRSGRGKKEEKVVVPEEEAPKKKPAAKGRAKKKVEENEVDKTEEIDSQKIENKEDANKEELAKKPKGRGKKAAATQKTTAKETEPLKATEEESKTDEPLDDAAKVIENKPKAGGRKKKEVVKNEAPPPVVVEKETTPEPTKEKVLAKKSSRNSKKQLENLEEESTKEEPPKKKGRAAKKEISVELEPEVKTETTEKKPTKRGRAAATSKTTAKTEDNEVDSVTEEVLPKKRSRKAPVVEKEIVEEKPKKGRSRGKKAADKPQDIQPQEDIQTNGADNLENVPETEELPLKEPSVEKEIVEEKPKKGRSRKKADKLEDVVETQVKEDIETNGKDNLENIEEIKEPQTSDKKAAKKPAAVATTARGGRKRAAPSANKQKPADNYDNEGDIELEEDEADGSKPSKTKSRKSDSAPLNATTTKYDEADFDLAPLPEGQTAEEPRFNLKISSWNVAGLRSWLKKEGLKYLEYEKPDIFCMQETKCTTDQLPEEVQRIPGYHPYWLCMPGGYAGVAIYSKIMPINVEYGIGNKEFDDSGRIITAEYEKFFLVNVYVPNSGRKLVNLEPRMKWEKLFQEFIQDLNARKPVVICGDMNVSHQEHDLANPKTNTRNAGFTKEERDKMSELLSLGYIDTFRHLYPERKGAYTFWTYMGNARSRNVGWRLDYFLVSERFVPRVVDNCIRSQCMGSDHCPITLFLKL